MGVRLYPNTTNVAKLEKLANVPEGTHNRMEEMAKRHEAALVGIDRHDRYELEYKQWQERNDDRPIGDLDAFLTFGWGKFRPIDGIGEDYAGRENDLQRAASLLRYNGINADTAECEGVHWC